MLVFTYFFLEYESVSKFIKWKTYIARYRHVLNEKVLYPYSIYRD